nr:endolytic transglycosylase MltG [uncultured Campylobacter sp.]
MKFFIKLIKAACICIELAAIVLLAVGFDLHERVGNAKTVQIGQGSSTKILSELSKSYPKFSKFDARLLSFYGGAKTGELELSGENLPKYQFLYELSVAKPVMNEIKLIPGETTIVFLKQLAKDRGLSFSELEREYNATAPFYEGFLVPETYKISKNESEKNIIDHLISSAQKFHEGLSRELIGDYNATAWKQVLIKASVIQKEAANADEMPLVASVIDNRLAKNMRLQMDGTLNYGEFSHVKITPQRIRTDTSHYNTYLNDGLPKEPVCVVSRDAIRAVFAPAKSEYLYFMRNKKTGLHDFARTQAEHERNVKAQR